MKRTKVMLTFVQFSIAVKILFCRSVINSLLGNAYFLVPSISLDVLTSAVDALEVAAVAAQDGSHLNISIRNDAEKVVNEYFRNIASYVDCIAMGDETIILSSGFNPTKQPNAIHKAILAVLNGILSGCVMLIAAQVDKAGSYIWRMRKININGIEGHWVYITTNTQTTYEVTGLDVGSVYEFQFAPVTPDGVLEYCPAVTKLVL